MANNDKNSLGFDLLEEEESSGIKKWGPYVGAGVLVCCLGGAAFALINAMSGTSAPTQPLVQQISIVQPPPPPPPPPKMEEPEPEMEEVEIEEPEPEPLADDSSMDEAPGEELGLDADGVAGSDGFGLKARKGGRGLVGGDPNAWYAGILQRDIQDRLSDDESVKSGSYSVVVKIWLDENGVIQDSELVSGSNNPDLDAALRRALSNGVQISRTPPEELPQPIRLRISSRG